MRRHHSNRWLLLLRLLLLVLGALVVVVVVVVVGGALRLERGIRDVLARGRGREGENGGVAAGLGKGLEGAHARVDEVEGVLGAVEVREPELEGGELGGRGLVQGVEGGAGGVGGGGQEILFFFCMGIPLCGLFVLAP